MIKEEYLQRFKTAMLKHRETFHDGSSVAEYADEVGPLYWEGNDGEFSPEEDAESDVDCWEVVAE